MNRRSFLKRLSAVPAAVMAAPMLVTSAVQKGAEKAPPAAKAVESLWDKNALMLVQRAAPVIKEPLPYDVKLGDGYYRLGQTVTLEATTASRFIPEIWADAAMRSAQQSAKIADLFQGIR